MDFVLPDGNSIRLLAPLGDMFNHSPEVAQCHAYDVSSGNLSILAGKDYEAGDQVCSSRSLIVPMCALTWDYLRFSSTMELFRITAFYASMGLSYLAILTIVTILFLQRTLKHLFLSESISSGCQLGSIRLVPSPSLSPIHYQKMCFDISVFSDRTNRTSLP